MTPRRASTGLAKRFQETKATRLSGLIQRELWLPTVDNLRNFFLTTTTEALSFFQQLREAP